MVAQVKRNKRADSLCGNPPCAVQQGVVCALGAYQKRATHVLESDPHAVRVPIDLPHEPIRGQRAIDLGDLDV